LLGGAVVCLLVALFIKEGLGGMLGLLLHEPVFFASATWSAISWGVGIVLWLAVGGLTKGSMGAWLLFVLFVIHALVGAVELGTDGWIQNITGNILSPKQGNLLFVITSLMMFALRFCANFIEKRIGLSPIGILLTCALLACFGLNLVSGIQTFGGAVGALLVYAVGKTFFWPTMLAVTSDRFPRTGAVAISIMGGIGMMSAGLIGSKGLGYAKDRFAGEELQKADPAIYAEYKAQQPSKFLIFSDVYGLDGAKLGAVTSTEVEKRDAKQKTVAEANMRGDRRTLVADSAIPATMALLYFLIFLYFKATGGYRAVHLEGTSAKVHG
jgi:hypothetical protein